MNTKDYIYLDEDLLNSHLAQFEKGLLIKETSEHGIESTDSTNGSTSANIGVNGILGFGLKLQNQVSEGDSSTESEFTKNIVENALNDYAVDLLIQHCTESGMLHDFTSASEGDFICYESVFQIYDFDYLKEITDPECLKYILPASPSAPNAQASKKERTEYLKQKEKAEKASNAYNTLYRFSSFAAKLFADSILVKLQECLVICKRDKLRLNKAQVSFENESRRKIHVLCAVSTVKEKTHPKWAFTPMSANDLDKISSLLFDITLSTFNMLHDNDKIIKPIAIYFESD